MCGYSTATRKKKTRKYVRITRVKGRLVAIGLRGGSEVKCAVFSQRTESSSQHSHHAAQNYLEL